MSKIPQLENATSYREDNHSFFSHLRGLKPTRLTVFTSAFLFFALISLSYVFLRPAVYSSYATLLTVPRTAVDQVSRDADIQHVAIQKQVLLGVELLTETASRLQQHANQSKDFPHLTAAQIRGMLDVRPVADTNLVEMVAEGNNPDLLPTIINTWIDVYLGARKALEAYLMSSAVSRLHQTKGTWMRLRAR